MTSQVNKMAVATAAAFSILWLICSLFVAVIPKASMALTGTMVHADLSNMSWSLTLSGFFIGLIGWAVLGALTGWLITFIFSILDCFSNDKQHDKSAE